MVSPVCLGCEKEPCHTISDNVHPLGKQIHMLLRTQPASNPEGFGSAKTMHMVALGLFEGMGWCI